MERIFEDAPLQKQSFMQKLLKQYPEDNSVILLNNWLARKPVREITAQQVAKLCKKYKTNIYKNYARNLEEIYASYLNFCFRDHSLSNEEMEDLKHLREILQISSERAETIYNLVVERVYKQNFEEILKDGKIDESERNFINKLKAQIKIPDSIADKISNELKGDYVHKYIDQIVSDKELSPDEEKELDAIMLNLGVTLDVDKKTRDHLQRYKIYWAIDNQDLPILKTDLKLHEGEHCYYHSWGDWYELKDNAMTRMDTGTIYLTSMRLIFTGEHKISTIHYDQILTSSIIDDGVEIDKETGADPIIKPSGDPEMMGRILRKLLK